MNPLTACPQKRAMTAKDVPGLLTPFSPPGIFVVFSRSLGIHLPSCIREAVIQKTARQFQVQVCLVTERAIL